MSQTFSLEWWDPTDATVRESEKQHEEKKNLIYFRLLWISIKHQIATIAKFMRKISSKKKIKEMEIERDEERKIKLERWKKNATFCQKGKKEWWEIYCREGFASNGTF